MLSGAKSDAGPGVGLGAKPGAESGAGTADESGAHLPPGPEDNQML